VSLARRIHAVAVAVRLDSEDAPWLMAHTAALPRHDTSAPTYLIFVVPPRGLEKATDEVRSLVKRNLDIATARGICPIIEEATNVPDAIVHVAHAYSVEILVVGPGVPRLFGPSTTQQLVHMDRRFDVLVATQREGPIVKSLRRTA
jgi:hypothetical protein